MTYNLIGDSNQRETWLRLRRTGIGASESPAILGASPWSSGLAVYAEKIDTDAPLEAEDERLMWGHRLEPVILERFSEVTGRADRYRMRGALLQSKRWPFMLATLDGMAEVDGADWVVEIKNTQDRSGWSDGVPKHVWIQLQHQLAVTGCAMGSVAVLISGCEFKWADVKRDDEFIDQILIPECEKFWKLVENGGPPPQTDGSEASRVALKRLYPNDSGDTVKLDGSFTDRADERVELKARIKADGERLMVIENAVKQEIGEGKATFAATQHGGEFSWRANKHGARTLRYKQPRGV